LAILREHIELDVKLTNRSHGFLNTRARRARDAEHLPLYGHGRSGAHFNLRETVNYCICSLTTFCKASEVADEIRAFAALPLTKNTRNALTKDKMWGLEDGKIPESWCTFGGALGWLLTLTGTPEELGSPRWSAIAKKYDQGTISIRRSVDTRDATITLETAKRGDPPLHIQFAETLPEEFSVLCPVWETVAVPFHYIDAFGRLLAGVSDD